MNCKVLYPLIFLVIFQSKYFVEASGKFKVNEVDVIESEFKYTLSEWSKETTPEEGVWRIDNPDGTFIECKEGGILRYVKMRDGSEYFQLYETADEEERETATDGGTTTVTHRVRRGDPVALLQKGLASIHLALGVKVIISFNDAIRVAYGLRFQSGDDARDFVNFFDKLRTDSLPLPTE